MDGATVDMVNRYPAATATGIQRAAGIDTPANEGLAVAVAGGAITFTGVNANNAAACVITYNPAAVNAAPIVTIVASPTDC